MCLLDTATAFFCTSSLSKNVSFIEEREQWIFFEQNILGPDLPIYAFSQSILRQRRIFLLRQVRADGRGQAGIGPFITYGQKHCRRLRRHPNLFSLPSNTQASASLLLDHPSFSRQKWPFKAAAPSPPSPILPASASSFIPLNSAQSTPVGRCRPSVPSVYNKIVASVLVLFLAKARASLTVTLTLAPAPARPLCSVCPVSIHRGHSIPIPDPQSALRKPSASAVFAFLVLRCLGRCITSTRYTPAPFLPSFGPSSPLPRATTLQ